jgi:hypothetical protein
VRIELYFPEAPSGDIPFHCPLVDPEDNAMMGLPRVVPRPGEQHDAAPFVPICRSAAQGAHTELPRGL